MKKNINQQIADKLNGMDLSERARRIIDNTDINIIAECFGGLDTADAVEQYIREVYDVDYIAAFLRARVGEGQAEYEMVQDGYAGNIDAYIEDYMNDFEVVDGEDQDGMLAPLIHRKGYDEYYEDDGQPATWYTGREELR